MANRHAPRASLPLTGRSHWSLTLAPAMRISPPGQASDEALSQVEAPTPGLANGTSGS